MTQPALLQALPNNRSYEQVLNHYLLEKKLASDLKAADRERRSEIYAVMYDTLFAAVPDHPRLTRRDSESRTRKAMDSKWAALKRFLKSDSVAVEWAPGDCRFSFELSKHCRQVYGVEIADQLDGAMVPDNFELVIYDGYQLELEDNIADLVFSDQLLEHIHPDDASHHFQLILGLLKPGGLYVCRTPHRFSGPHDVSKYFSREAEGFHLKEYTYAEARDLAKKAGFSKVRAYWKAKNIVTRLPMPLVTIGESLVNILPANIKRKISRYLFPSVFIAAEK